MTKPASSSRHVAATPEPCPAWALTRARLSDVPAILDLVVQAARDGDLNPQYLQLPYQIGLAKSLFAALLLRRFKDAAGTRRQARVMVARQGLSVVGFGLVCDAKLPVPQPVSELYLLCVAQPHRGRGIARCLIEHARQQQPQDQSLLVISFQRSRSMSRLMRASGATPLGEVRLPGNGHVPLHAHAYGATEGLDALRAALRARSFAADASS